jgi:hypothetical protein
MSDASSSGVGFAAMVTGAGGSEAENDVWALITLKLLP